MHIQLLLCLVLTIFSVSAFYKYGSCWTHEGFMDVCSSHLIFTSNPEINDLNIIPNASAIYKIVVSLDVNASKIVLFPIKMFEQFSSLRVVRIPNVGMECLEKESLRNANRLYSLVLPENNIKKIPANVITLAPRLGYLELSGNEISEIEDYAFNSSSLEELYLHNNNIKTIKRTYFCYAYMLRCIHLSNNLIEDIEVGAFDLPGLKFLLIDRNNIITLPLNLFANARSLWELKLNTNKLTTEALPALLQARHLWHLNLANNPTLSGSNLSVVSELHNLLMLNLSNCSLTDETIRNFQKMPRLKELYIRSNNLSNINLLHHLSRLKNLETIDISENNYTKLDAFVQIDLIFPQLERIILNDNQWDCAWVETVKKSRWLWPRHNNYHC